MRLLSCSHPKRVYNKYSGEYVFVPCGECAICKNRRASHYTALLERERLQHKYCFFVTLTYSDEKIPVLNSQDFFQRDTIEIDYFGSRERDGIRIPFTDLFPKDKKGDYLQADIDFFAGWLEHGGLPYASKTDVQLFLKRLNKYAHDKITHQFKNFRYFIVSELGSTTFRPHFHGIFFVDDDGLASQFEDCVSSCWQLGIIDSQSVENSACGYVAQYINKSADMPYVYQHKSLRPFFLCSRNPFIGTLSKCEADDKEIVDNSIVTSCIREKPNSNKFVVVPHEQSYQNRLFPKCPCYGSVTDTLRTQFYSISRRFCGETLQDFLGQIFDYMVSLAKDELALYLRAKLNFSKLDFKDYRNPLLLFDEVSFNFLRRLFYFGRKVARQACQFGLSIYAYTKKIVDYYNNKEIYLLHEQYQTQEIVSADDVEACACMYPEFLFNNNYTVVSYAAECDCSVVNNQIADAIHFYFSNKKTHFKNAYFDSLRLKETSKFLYNLLKTYFYAKKCNETLEAFAA